MRFVGYLFLLALIAFGIWPYYQVFRLDQALGNNDTAALGELVDLSAVRRNYKERLQSGLGVLPSVADGGDGLKWLTQNLQRLGDAALDQVITLQWVSDTIKSAAARATTKRPPYLIAAITFAFFESYDSFIIRLGELGKNATHIRMRLEHNSWRVTDIILQD
jgi:hypothetical protein